MPPRGKCVRGNGGPVPSRLRGQDGGDVGSPGGGRADERDRGRSSGAAEPSHGRRARGPQPAAAPSILDRGEPGRREVRAGVGATVVPRLEGHYEPDEPANRDLDDPAVLRSHGHAPKRKAPEALSSSTATPAQLAVLCANLNSFVLDYCARQLIGGIHVTNTLMKELPVLPPVVESSPIPLEWFVERAVELSFTSEDLRAFAEDCGHSGSPASWCEESRAQARAELDAAFFHLYGVSRGDVEYILETFPIVKRKDMKKYGAYRTKEQILEVFDRVIQRTS